MADYKLGFYGEEIDLKLQEIETLKESIEQLEENDETVAAAIERIDAAITALSNSSTGAVKHIQRGVVSITSYPLNISLSGFTDSSKMIAIIDGEAYYYSSLAANAYVNTLSVNSLSLNVFANNASNAKPISYQVIEFY